MEKLMAERLRFHRENPEPDLATYKRCKRIVLGKSLATKSLVYLDTNFWVYLCEVALGRAKKKENEEMSKRLYALVAQGLIVCPFSYAQFMEIMRQSDDRTRLQTAKIMDDLSLSICIQNPWEVAIMEVEQLFQEQKPHHSQFSKIRERVWTKATDFHGEMTVIPAAEGIAPSERLAVAKTVDDLNWSISLSELVDFIGKDQERWQTTPDFSSGLNQEKEAFASENQSFEEHYKKQLAGIIAGHENQIYEAAVAVQNEDLGADSSPPDASIMHQIKSLIYTGLVTKKFQLKLPTLHIQASLHAAFRADKGRKYKPNDWQDFYHAVTALPYFDFLLTERSLKHVFTTPPLCLDALYGAQVLCGEEEILACEFAKPTKAAS